MSRVVNFSAGPAALPLPVLEQIQAELLDWRQTGVSILELGHRTEEFMGLLAEIEKKFRTLLKIPANYQVLFLHGGARAQFAMIPMSFSDQHTKATYLNTGFWSQIAIKEAERYLQPDVAATCCETLEGLSLPEQSKWQIDPKTAYFHYTSNETIEGFELFNTPEFSKTPLISDMTSNILARPIDVSRYGLIYASTQKNMGCAGLAIAIVRDDLLENISEKVPSLFNYKLQAAEHSLGNTLPTFACYVSGLMFEWLLKEGGLSVVAKRNQAKARLLYQMIDESNGFYVNSVSKPFRSEMNIPFFLQSAALTAEFLMQAERAGLKYLKGHRVSGGVRASIYNALSLENVSQLADFMKEFMNHQ